MLIPFNPTDSKQHEWLGIVDYSLLQAGRQRELNLPSCRPKKSR